MRRRAGKAKYLAELLFPPRCALCGGVRPMAARCCASCESDFARLRLAPEDADLSGAPGREGESLDGVCASFLYAPPVSDAVAEYKFRGAAWLAREFAEFIADDFSAVFPAVTPDIALGAPSFERRNDHAERLASQVARLLAVRYEPRALRKIRPTEKQHTLGADARAKNLLGAFEADAGRVSGRVVLIVDDVTTSGATLERCAAALREAGAQRVYAAAFCAAAKRTEEP